MTKVFFIIGITMFFLFIVQISAMWGTTILNNTNNLSFTAPAPPSNILDALGYIVANFGIFFTIMSVSSGFLIFGSVIVIAYVIGMFWAVLELIRGV